MRIEEFKLERFFAKHETDAPYMLGASDCETFSVNEIVSTKEIEELHSLKLGYSSSQGLPILRKEIAKQFQNVTYDEIVVSAPQEGIFITLNALLNAGDKTVIQVPCYQSLCSIPKAIGCKVATWAPSILKNQWHFNIEELKAKVDKTTKLIIINSPHNPTGYHFSPKEFEEIIEIAKEYKCYLLSDEMYRTLILRNDDLLPVGSDIYEKCISLSGVSKTFGLGGLRIGWLSIKEKTLLQKVLKFKDFTTLSNSVLSEFVALVALQKSDLILSRNLDIIQDNLKILDEFFSRHTDKFQWLKPKAGTVALVKTKFAKNTENFCEDLISKKGVLLMPGTKFDYDDCFRIGFGRKNLDIGLKQLDSYLKEKAQKIFEPKANNIKNKF
jgi:aspartate/methionine/tyrosine aminotransferase